jgi:carbohydrate-selective porin OprB
MQDGTSHTVSVSELAQEPRHALNEMQQRGVSFQGVFVNDWSEDLNNSSSGFGRYSLDLGLTLDGKKALRWSGTSAYVRLKQHINEFGDIRSDAAQVVSNIDATPRTTLYELWLQQTLLSQRLRIKFGKIDANTEFDQVQSASDFLNSSMGYSPTIMAFPSYPEPKLAAVASYSWRRSDQIGLGVFRTVGAGILTIAEPGHSWSIRKYDLPGHLSVGYWRLTGSLQRLNGSHSAMTQGVYSVFEQAVWRQALKRSNGERSLSAFFQFGHSDRVMCDLTEHVGAGAVLQGPFSVRGQDSVGVAFTGVQFSRYGNAGEERHNESVMESYYKFAISSKVSFIDDFQLVLHPGGLRPVRNYLIFTPRVVISF